MKNRIKLLLLTTFGILLFYLYQKYNYSTNIKIKCYYMAYACGDCEPQYKIVSIYKDPANCLIKGEDVELKIMENGNKIDLSSKINKCWICYEYNVEGKIEYSLFNKKIIIVNKYDLKLRNECCDE